MNVETVLEAKATIGESALWDPSHRVLYWGDIKQPALHRYNPETGATRSWQVTSDLGAFALMEDGGALLAMRKGLHRLDLESGALEQLAHAPYDPALFRFNEGACDATGRFWIGVMFDPMDGSPAPRAGALHSFTLKDGLRCEPDCARLHNGFAFSRDGTRMFLAHSYERKIYRYEYAADGGVLGQRRLFATLPEACGIPDGAAIDSEGGYWCALHGGGAIRRYTPEGQVDRDIEMPVSQPTMCAFAGPDLEWLYVTSASDELTQEQRRQEPLAGALFRCKPEIKGAAKPFMVR